MDSTAQHRVNEADPDSSEKYNFQNLENSFYYFNNNSDVEPILAIGICKEKRTYKYKLVVMTNSLPRSRDNTVR